MPRIDRDDLLRCHPPDALPPDLADTLASLTRCSFPIQDLIGRTIRFPGSGEGV